MKNCKHKLYNPIENKVLCGAYSENRLPNGKIWAHYPECKNKNCPLIRKAEQCLIDNGIEADEAETVLQALGYILLDEELYQADAFCCCKERS